MKYIKFLLLISLVVTELFGKIKSQCFLDKKSVNIADIVKYNVILEFPSEFTLKDMDIYTAIIDTAGVQCFVLMNKQQKKIKKFFSNKTIEKYIFHLMPIQLGNQKIGPLEVSFVNTTTNEIKIVKLPEISLEVKPVEKPKNRKFDGEIVDIKGQIWIYKWYLWFILLLIFIICGIIFYLKNKKIRTQTASVLQQELDAKELALKRLQELWLKDYISKMLIKEFYLELTEIVKEYISYKYKINALELTTEELFHTLKKFVDKKYNLKLKSFLDNADLAKFAKYIPEVAQIKQDFDTAKELII